MHKEQIYFHIAYIVKPKRPEICIYGFCFDIHLGVAVEPWSAIATTIFLS